MLSNKIVIRLSTFNIILLIAGYSVVTSVLCLLMPQTEESQVFTIPYRLFELVISTLTIFVNLRNRVRWNREIKMFLVFWLFLIVRFVFDFYIINGNYPSKEYLTRTWLFMVGLTIIPIFSLLKSYKNIDLNRAYWWIYILFAISVICTYFSSRAFQEASEERLRANVAFGTIEAGHLGLSVVVLSVFSLYKLSGKIVLKFVISVIGVLGFLVLLRAGSRGPILSLLGIISLVLLSVSKNKFKNLLILAIIGTLIYLFYDDIIRFISGLSPILKARLFEEENQLNSREFHFAYAWNAFLKNPILGYRFAIPLGHGIYMYSHNIILDTMMQLGIVGLFLLLYIVIKSIYKSVILIVEKKSNLWVGLMFVQYFFKLLVSGAIYTEPLFSVLIVLLNSERRNYEK